MNDDQVNGFRKIARPIQQLIDLGHRLARESTQHAGRWWGRLPWGRRMILLGTTLVLMMLMATLLPHTWRVSIDTAGLAAYYGTGLFSGFPRIKNVQDRATRTALWPTCVLISGGSSLVFANIILESLPTPSISAGNARLLVGCYRQLGLRREADVLIGLSVEEPYGLAVAGMSFTGTGRYIEHHDFLAWSQRPGTGPDGLCRGSGCCSGTAVHMRCLAAALVCGADLGRFGAVPWLLRLPWPRRARATSTGS